MNLYFQVNLKTYISRLSLVQIHFNMNREDYSIENVDESQSKNPKNFYLETPLHWAADNGHLYVYQYLIRNVEDKNPQNREGSTPLQYAGMKNYHCFENFVSEYLKEEAENEKLKKEFP